MKTAELEGTRVLILGFAREGQDTFAFLRKRFPDLEIGAADRRELKEFPKSVQNMLARASWHFGPRYLKALPRYDVIVKSPGVPTRELRLSEGQRITSQADLFLSDFPGTVIGVTGTKGKSTTAAMIAHVLKSGGVNARLAGNIGEPVLSHLGKAKADDVFVYELSSFQLEHVERSPHIAVFLNLYPEHLDFHGTFRKYKLAKANITKYQTPQDYLIFNKEDPEVAKIAKKSRAKKIPFSPLESKRNRVFAASLVPAILVGNLFGLKKSVIEHALATFKPLPHRLERVGTWKGITFYNDSLATVGQATAAALETLGRDVSAVILGGFDRGISFEPLAKAILESGVQTLILLPDTGANIWEAVQKEGRGKRLPRAFFAGSMEEAVRICYEETRRGKICLLSPASPSFNMFRDYKERGETFIAAVKRYGKKKA